jgi:hypothetical protein
MVDVKCSTTTIGVIKFSAILGHARGRHGPVIRFPVVARHTVGTDVNGRRITEVGDVQIIGGNFEGSELGNRRRAPQAAGDCVLKRVVGNNVLVEARDRQGHGLEVIVSHGAIRGSKPLTFFTKPPGWKR